MKKIIVRFQSIERALKILDKTLNKFNELIAHADLLSDQPSQIGLDFSDLFLAIQELMIQRFEYCTDLYWKYLKDYLEIQLKITPQQTGPKNIIREATRAKLLTEHESYMSLEMINDRNQTSHIYREEIIAEQIACKIPQYYTLMKKVVDTLKPTD